MVLLINVGAYAQKDQIKYAQSAFGSGKSDEALGVLKKIEYMIYNSTDEEKSDFYFLKGNILKDLALKNNDIFGNFSSAGEAYQELIKAESESGKFKYTLQANTALREMKAKLATSALQDFKATKYKESSEKYYKVYTFDKRDTLYLFNAASTSLTAKDYDSAIKYYEELKKINYSGKGVIYYATNKKTKEEESFVSESVRDASIAAGLHEKPRNVNTPSRRLEVVKNLAYVYLEKNDFSKSEICYNKVVEMEPNFIDAYLNLTYIKMQSKKALMEEMSALGNTPKELALYDKLNIKKDDVIRSTIPYLKKALSIDPKNQEVIKSLLGVYRSLDMNNEFNSLKASM